MQLKLQRGSPALLMALSQAGHINDNDNEIKALRDVCIDPDERLWSVMVFNGWCSQSTPTPTLLAQTLIRALLMAGNPDSHACGQNVHGMD